MSVHVFDRIGDVKIFLFKLPERHEKEPKYKRLIALVGFIFGRPAFESFVEKFCKDCLLEQCSAIMHFLAWAMSYYTMSYPLPYFLPFAQVAI